MGRAPCCSKVGLHRGPWTPREDTLLTKYIETHGEGNWRALPKKAGLLRCGKSCRLRWMNYLRPDIKRGNISSDEDDLIIRLHVLLGNRWSLIAGRLPGRTDNEIKNYWNTHLSKKLRLQGIDPETHKTLPPGSGQAETKSKKSKSKKRKTSTLATISSHHNRKQKHQTSNNKNGTNKDGQAHPDEKKHIVHLPKPVRVTSFSVLPRNDSFMSTTDNDHINVSTNNAETGATFFIGDSPEQGVGGEYHMMNNDSDDHHLTFDDRYQLCAGGDQDDFFSGEHSLEQLYDEYLQVLKTTDEVDNDDQMLHLDSFAESFLV